jgi:hypothetical protein
LASVEHGFGIRERAGSRDGSLKLRLDAGNQILVAVEAEEHHRALTASICGGRRRSTPVDQRGGEERAWRGQGGAELHREADGGLAEVEEALEQPELPAVGDGRRRKTTTVASI